MKLLVLSVSTGQGHNSTGAAVSNVFSGHGADCRTLDVFSNRSKLLGNAVSKGYLLSVTAFSGIYSKSYARLENRKRDHKDFTTFLCRLASGKLRKKVLENFFPSEYNDQNNSKRIVECIKERLGLQK